MNQTKKQLDSEHIWMMVFTILPMIIASNYSEYFSEDGWMQALYSGLFGGAGVMIGLTVFFLTKNKGTLLKLSSLLILLALVITPIRFFSKPLNHSEETAVQYSTCHACGYIAYDQQEKYCDNCGLDLSEDNVKQSGLNSPMEMILLEQVMYFVPENEGDSLTLYKPEITADGFKKDSNWKPLVASDSLRKLMIDYFKYKEEANANIDAAKIKIEVIKE